MIINHHPSDQEYEDPKIYSGIMKKLGKFHSLQHITQGIIKAYLQLNILLRLKFN